MLCVTPEGLQKISESSLEDFDRKIGGIPPDDCLPFNQAAGNLEAELNHSYRFVATIGRGLDDLDEISQLWESFVKICDQYAKRLHDLHQAHPICGADYFYDRVLDLRNKCKRLVELHR